MRYGKVYFYDRMGNRKPTESDKIQEALENFDAPNFRPPHTQGRSYHLRNDIPLESPPIFTGPDPILPRFSPGGDDVLLDTTRKYNFDNSDILDISDSALNRTRVVNFDDPREFNPINSLNLKEDLQSDIDDGIAGGFSSKEALDEEMRKFDLNKYQLEDEPKRVFSDGVYSVHDLCSQCRLEEEHVKKWKREAEDLKEKHRRMAERAAIYEANMKQKDEESEKERLLHAMRLTREIDEANREMIEEAKKRNVKSPPNDYYIFKDRVEVTEDEQIAKKEHGDQVLLRQIEEKKRRELHSAQKELMLDNLRNHQAAQEYAKIRDFDQIRIQQDQEKWRKQLELQMELQKAAPPIDNNWLWWAERPDEHGWRQARSALKNDQVERNVLLKNSGKRLEQFIQTQKEIDSRLQEVKREHYAKLRDKLHANSELIFGSKTEQSSHKPVIVQPNIQVENAWRNAHEQNEKKYRILQESTERTGEALEKKLKAITSCTRCARCTRPLNRMQTFVLSKEKIY